MSTEPATQPTLPRWCPTPEQHAAYDAAITQIEDAERLLSLAARQLGRLAGELACREEGLIVELHGLQATRRFRESLHNVSRYFRNPGWPNSVQKIVIQS